MKFQGFLLLVILFGINGCAGMNPNPSERTADTANASGDYGRAVSIIMPAAERGEPWAQLRLGVYYEKGIAIEKDIQKAVSWYKKCAIQMGEGGWANGMLVGSVGRYGYFNQNTDALIAQWRLANILLEGNGVKKDLIKAYLLANNVVKESKGKSLFYCCEWMKGGGLYITQEMINKTMNDIIQVMTQAQKDEAQLTAQTWNPQTGL